MRNKNIEIFKKKKEEKERGFNVVFQSSPVEKIKC